MTGMRLLFWVSTLTIVYVYAGYPLLLMIWARMRPRRTARGAARGSTMRRPPHPTVSILIAARNEASRLPARIENLLALAYPADRREIIVVSDGSSDDTLAVLGRFPAVQAIAAPAAGKAAPLHPPVPHPAAPLPLFPA